MKKTLLLFLGLISCISVFSQTEAYSTDVKQCLKSNGTYTYYESVFDACFSQIESQYSKFGISEETWDELKSVKPQAMEDVSDKLVIAYQDYFNHDDVKRMNTLFASKTGQTMLSNPAALTKKDKKTIDEFYKSATGKKITKSQAGMQEKMQVISDFWCGEMYKTVNEKLEEKGYSVR